MRVHIMHIKLNRKSTAHLVVFKTFLRADIRNVPIRCFVNPIQSHLIFKGSIFGDSTAALKHTNWFLCWCSLGALVWEWSSSLCAMLGVPSWKETKLFASCKHVHGLAQVINVLRFGWMSGIVNLNDEAGHNFSSALLEGRIGFTCFFPCSGQKFPAQNVPGPNHYYIYFYIKKTKSQNPIYLQVKSLKREMLLKKKREDFVPTNKQLSTSPVASHHTSLW